MKPTSQMKRKVLLWMNSRGSMYPLAVILIVAIFFLSANFLRNSLSNMLPIFQGTSASQCSSILLEATNVLDGRDASRPAFFFVESSARGSVSARQACAVESAALLHPEADVYLLLLSPPYGSNIIDSNPALQQLYANYPNVQVLYFHLHEYFRDSPLEEWYKKGLLNASRYKTSHTSDVFRYFTLWKYGGIYMDLDMVLMRSLRGMKSFAGAVAGDVVSASLMHLEPRSEVATACVKMLKENFRGDLWGTNGPLVITKVMQQVCGTNDTSKMSREQCQGRFEVLPIDYFYPIFWKNWKPYFEEANANATMKLILDSYAIHVWNKFSVNVGVRVGSKQPYGQVAAKFCPKVYFGCGPVF